MATGTAGPTASVAGTGAAAVTRNTVGARRAATTGPARTAGAATGTGKGNGGHGNGHGNGGASCEASSAILAFVDATCPCAGPDDGAGGTIAWKNHGQYVPLRHARSEGTRTRGRREAALCEEPRAVRGALVLWKERGGRVPRPDDRDLHERRLQQRRRARMRGRRRLHDLELQRDERRRMRDERR